MGEEEIPAIGGERNVSGGKGRNQMILVCPDSALGGVGAMVDGRDVLVLDRRGRLTEKNREVLTRLIV